MDSENDQPSDLAKNFKDVVVTLRVHAEEIPQDIVYAIIRNDIDEVAYKVDGVEYHFAVLDVSFVDDMKNNKVH